MSFKNNNLGDEWVVVESKGSGQFFKFSKIGDSLTGVYLGSKYNPTGRFGEEVVQHIKTEEGIKKFSTKPNRAVVDDLKGLEGLTLIVTFSGTKPGNPGSNPMKLFTITENKKIPRLAPEYLLQTGDDSEYSEPETRTALPTGTIKREEVIARLQAAKRKN